MRISAFSVKNPQFTLVLFVCLAVLGVQAFRTIPRAEDPSFPLPIYSVVAVYPGATPAQMEREVVDKLEEEISEIGELKKLRTKILANVALLLVEFEPGVDAAKKLDEVQRQVDAARPELPADVRSVDVQQADTTNVSMLQVAVLAPDAPWARVQEVTERIARRLESVPGVKEVDTHGYPEQEARVDLDLGRLARANVPTSQVIQALAGGNASVPGGEVDLGARRFVLETTGAYSSVEDIGQTVVAGGPGGTLRVTDVATVALRPEPTDELFRYDGTRGALIAVTMRDGQNIFSVRDALLAEIEHERASLPAGMRLELAFDQSHNVAHRLSGLQRDFVIAIVLVLLTLIPLGMRVSLVVMVSIPMSLAIGVFALKTLGFSLNQLSIVGFVIALGLLVDDSIVVAENIARWIREGETRQSAAIKATRQIGIAVLGCTATLVFAFLPLLFLPGNAGEFIRSLPAAVVVTILASLLVSLTLIPFLASKFLRGDDEHGNWAFRATSRLIERAYRPVLAFVMKRPKLTLLFAGVLVAGAFSLVPKIGFSLFPKAGIPQVLVNINAPDGASLDYTDGIARQVEAAAKRQPGIRATMVTVGKGHPQLYYNRASASPSAETADVVLLLEHYDPLHTPAMLDALRAELAQIPGAEISIREFENGPPVDSPIAIRVLGDDLDQLRVLSAKVAHELAATPGTRDVRDPLAARRTDLAVALDEGKAGLVGVPPIEVDRAVRMAVRGLPVGTLRQSGGEEIDLVVALPGPTTPNLDALDHVYVPSLAGGQVPLAQIADVEMRSKPSLIAHHNRQRVVTITADVASGANAQAVTNVVLAKLEHLQLPDGYRWEAAGLVESQKESFSGLGPAVIIAIFGVLAILILEFRSFAATLIVFAVVPLGAMGGLIALYLAGETLSFTASIGFIALTGIEVKNSLLLVDFTAQLREQGMPLEEAIRKAGEIRFFPILLTSLTAIGGLIPLVLEHSALYSPLALVLIGGLTSSTILSRLITPVLSKLLLPRDERVGHLADSTVERAG
ncbi:MAG: efflux RND transporter permease subunit [Kofleriaceae bacterium]|nr:efflux RND transporter permease subunit [Kofleriaceae bacterium]